MTCLTPPGAPPVVLPPAIAPLPSSILAVNPTPGSNPFVTPGQAAINGFLVNQFETEGGVFPYNTREYLASGRLDHRFNNTTSFL